MEQLMDQMDVSMESLDSQMESSRLPMGGEPSGQQPDALNLNDEMPVSYEEYPPPPEFARLYTSENCANGTAPLPPPVPTCFNIFGEDIDLEAPPLRPLTEQNIPQHYSTNSDWRTEVKKVNQSIVFNFIDLVHILIHSPDSPERQEKLETIRTLFINIHHLVNEFRFCQSRDTLRTLIEDQIEETKTAIKVLKRRVIATDMFINNYYSLMSNLIITENGLAKGPNTIINETVPALSDDDSDDGEGAESGTSAVPGTSIRS